ncbi:MAG: 30S ribosomal protein S7 [Candidatus Pacearchaeota archaeon]
MKIFDLYSTENIKVNDSGLSKYINLKEKLVVKTHGRKKRRFEKAEVNIIERLINLLCVPGHRGKKHKIQTSWASGKYEKNAKVVLNAFRIIEEKTKQNPIQILIKAIENSAPCDEVTTIEYGGARYPVAVDVSPYRRLSLALRNIVHGAYDKSFNKKKNLAEGLADEIIAASQGIIQESFAVQKKNDLEKQADSAR